MNQTERMEKRNELASISTFLLATILSDLGSAQGAATEEQRREFFDQAISKIKFLIGKADEAASELGKAGS